MGRPAALPAPLSSFVGRRHEVAELTAALASSRLVSAVGPGGVGKTRLALRVAEATMDVHPGGTWYVDLVPVVDPAAVGDRGRERDRVHRPRPSHGRGRARRTRG